ncbi:MAG: hypothetical protein WKF94_15805 [Solirubrobacteraceae bacterium]
MSAIRGKRADMIVHDDEPYNAETAAAALADAPLTATDAFYVRGHGPWRTGVTTLALPAVILAEA